MCWSQVQVRDLHFFSKIIEWSSNGSIVWDMKSRKVGRSKKRIGLTPTFWSRKFNSFLNVDRINSVAILVNDVTQNLQFCSEERGFLLIDKKFCFCQNFHYRFKLRLMFFFRLGKHNKCKRLNFRKIPPFEQGCQTNLLELNILHRICQDEIFAWYFFH